MTLIQQVTAASPAAPEQASLFEPHEQAPLPARQLEARRPSRARRPPVGAGQQHLFPVEALDAIRITGARWRVAGRRSAAEAPK